MLTYIPSIIHTVYYTNIYLAECRLIRNSTKQTFYDIDSKCYKENTTHTDYHLPSMTKADIIKILIIKYLKRE